MLKIRNATVRVLRLTLIGIALFFTFIFRCCFEFFDWLWFWLDEHLPRPKLSPEQDAEWDAYEKEKRDRLTMTLAEFDAAYPPGDPLHWGETALHRSAVVVGPWPVGDDEDEDDGKYTDMKLHGIDVSVDVDSFQPKEKSDDEEG